MAQKQEFVTEIDTKDTLNPIIVSILARRGVVGDEAIHRFLKPQYERDVYDPFLFDDMSKAVARIALAIDAQELIVIHGDYDADGVCGSTLLYELLLLLGANVEVYLPHREKEGYGMRIPNIDRLKDKGCAVIITVDCGIANTDEVAHANTLGIDVIITDHHTEPADPDRIPKAYAIIHPRVHAERYPFDFLAGVGSAFKLSQGLIRTQDEAVLVQCRAQAKDGAGNSINWDAYEKWQLDLVAIATITDCMPLLEENRALVHYGFIVLEKTVRTGLRALMEQAGIVGQKPSTKMIGFDIGPRINAAGRIEHAQFAFDVLTAKDKERAQVLSRQLETINLERRKVSTRISEEVEQALEHDLKHNLPLLCAYNAEWPMGVLGLVAGRLSNKHTKPIVLFTQKNGLIEGTSRSVPGLSILDAFHRVSDLLHHYGGHAAAAGIALKEDTSLDIFRDSITPHIIELLSTVDVASGLEHDVSITLSDVSWDLVHTLNQLEPFGQGNQKPLFYIPSVTIEHISVIGKTGQHLRCVFLQGGTKRRAIGFSLGPKYATLQSGTIVDIFCEIDINEWNGQQELQLNLLDMNVHVS